MKFHSIVPAMEVTYHYTSESRIEALWRIMTLDASGFVRPAGPEVKQAFVEIITAGLLYQLASDRIRGSSPADIKNCIDAFQDLALRDSSNSSRIWATSRLDSTQ